MNTPHNSDTHAHGSHQFGPHGSREGSFPERGHDFGPRGRGGRRGEFGRGFGPHAFAAHAFAAQNFAGQTFTPQGVDARDFGPGSFDPRAAFAGSFGRGPFGHRGRRPLKKSELRLLKRAGKLMGTLREYRGTATKAQRAEAGIVLDNARAELKRILTAAPTEPSESTTSDTTAS